MQFEELQTKMAALFGVNKQDITPNLKLKDLPQWDSLNHLNLMLLLEQENGLTISEENIIRCTEVPGIIALLNGASN